MLDLKKFSKKISYSSGYWDVKTSTNISYPQEGNSGCFSLEENSSWFRHRNNVISTIISIWPPMDKVIFDVGGGNGFVSKRLQNDGLTPVLLEPGIQGVINSRNRGLEHIIHRSFQDCEFEIGSIPAVGLFDVIEHIDDDIAILKNIKKALKKDAMVFITVPAYKFLWSNEDTIGGQFRRYTIQSLKQSLKIAGLKLVYSTYFFAILPIPVFLARTLPSKIGFHKNLNFQRIRGNHKNSILDYILKFSAPFEISQIRKMKKIPFGTSILAVAQKTD